MNIDSVIAQLRGYAPLFGGNVAGAAAYADGVSDQVWLALPSAYVIPMDEDAEQSDELSGMQQIVRERIGICVVLETAKIGGLLDLADRRGQAAAAYLRTVRAAVFAAVLNWHPDWTPGPTPDAMAARGLYYVGGGFPEARAFDRARFFYQFVFGLDVTITDGDGWQYFGDPLIDIRGTVIPDSPVDLTIPIIFDSKVK